MPDKPKPAVRVPDRLLAGVYATQMVVRHTREEFLVDFINGFPPQRVVTARVIVSPGHLKRMIHALSDSLRRYEMTRGKPIVNHAAPPETPPPDVAQPGPAPTDVRAAEAPKTAEGAAEQPAPEKKAAGSRAERDLSCKLPEYLAPGAYANQMMIGHSRDEFLLDFISIFGAQGVVTARVFVGPQFVHRMIRAFRENLGRYESKYGMIIEATLPKGDYQLN
jgi:hypothetical protein